jgi:hypothetical protein
VWRNDRFYGDGCGMFPKAMAAASWETHLSVVFIGTVLVFAYGVISTGNGKPTLHDRLYGTTTKFQNVHVPRPRELVIGAAPLLAFVDGSLEESLDEQSASLPNRCDGGLSIFVGRSLAGVPEVELVNRSDGSFSFWFADNEKLNVDGGMRLLSGVPNGWSGSFNYFGPNVDMTHRTTLALNSGDRYVDMFCSLEPDTSTKGFQRS